MKTYKVKDNYNGNIQEWTLEQILEEINEGHSDEWTPYNEKDWREGWNEWIEPSGYFSLIE